MLFLKLPAISIFVREKVVDNIVCNFQVIGFRAGKIGYDDSYGNHCVGALHILFFLANEAIKESKNAQRKAISNTILTVCQAPRFKRTFS